MRRAFFGERIATLPRGKDGRYGIPFGAHRFVEIDQAMKCNVGYVSEPVSPVLNNGAEVDSR